MFDEPGKRSNRSLRMPAATKWAPTGYATSWWRHTALKVRVIAIEERGGAPAIAPSDRRYSFLPTCTLLSRRIVPIRRGSMLVHRLASPCLGAFSWGTLCLPGSGRSVRSNKDPPPELLHRPAAGSGTGNRCEKWVPRRDLGRGGPQHLSGGGGEKKGKAQSRGWKVSCSSFYIHRMYML